MIGKTILTSYVVDTLLEHRHVPVLYFYCKHDQTGKTLFTDVLRSLLVQLVQRDSALAACLHDACASKDHRSILSILEPLGETAFESQKECFVVIDGLDECPPKEAEKIISWLSSRPGLAGQAACSRLRLLFSGQRTNILLRLLDSAVDISLDAHEHRADVSKYVRGAARRLKDEFELDADTEADIVNNVTARATSKCETMPYAIRSVYPLRYVFVCKIGHGKPSQPGHKE